MDKAQRVFSTINEDGTFSGVVIEFDVRSNDDYAMIRAVVSVSGQPSRYFAKRAAAEAAGLDYQQLRKNHEERIVSH